MGQVNLGLIGLLHQDRYAGLKLRRFDGNRQAPAKTRLETLFEAFDLFRVAVTGQNHLLTTFKQGVEGVEELFLGPFLARKELNVIDQQGIHRTVEALEFVDGIELQGFDHIRYKTLGMQVHNLGIRVFLQQVVTHRVHQVSLTQTYAAIKEERVITVLGVVCHLPRRGASQLVGLALNEVFEGKGAVQVTGVLERTFNLDGALLGTHRRLLRAGAGHRVEAGARRLFTGGLGLLWSRGGRRCSRWRRSARRRGLLGGRCSQRRIGRSTRRRAAFAAY